ncbi:MAG: tRNA pseudouridine(38-40) synthase TruA [Deltaproteobacteria bacterium]|nr:tRNA pseudouridine(38-40) synthase TruA [Deltaproteobacteria bacterium]
MRNIKLLIEYEGTNYVGWQEQQGLPTIQGTIKVAIKKITGEDVKLRGASRTDAGVHAISQAANFKTNTTIKTISIQRALNSLLPSDIVIKDAQDVDDDFDSRLIAKGKTYTYIILNRSYPSAIHRNTSWFIPYKPVPAGFKQGLDIDLMKKGAELLIGEKDFSSFRAAACSSEHAIREIVSLSIVKENDFVIIEVKGNAFMMHMVRIIVGTLVDLGRVRITLEDFKNIIEARDRTKAGRTAPPHGLFLKEVEY